MEKKQDQTLLHSFQSSRTSLFSSTVIIVLLITALTGIVTGFVLSKMNRKVSHSSINKVVPSASGKKTVGSDNLKIYKDTAEGILKDGGIEGEGQFHLVRLGGDSQNVYLTSSIVDLSEFLDKKIKVWGETQKARKAGWLMDVGRVELE